MTGHEWAFAGLLLLAGCLIAAGAAIAYPPAGLIVGGLLLAAWSWLLLGDAG